MQIIFSNDIESIQDKYTVLELDTFRYTSGELCTSWCVVESVPLTEFSMMQHYIDLHKNLIIEYRKRNWDYCEQAIVQLTGKWNRELDSFYEILLHRVQKLKLHADSYWDPILAIGTQET